MTTTWDDSYQVSTRVTTVVNTGTSDVDSFADTLGHGAEWRYTVNKGSGANMRTGVIMACWDKVADSTPQPWPDQSSPDIGTTIGVISFSVVKSGNSVALQATATSDGWTVDVVRTLIGATT